MVEIAAFSMEAYKDALVLWQQCEGIGLSQADEPQPIAAYLARNPGMSFVAWEDGVLVGAVLCGHDGRRGFIHHLAVHPAHRRQGIAARLVNHCLQSLAQAGIQKCHLFIFHANESGKAFWRSQGWELRQDIQIMSQNLEEAE